MLGHRAVVTMVLTLTAVFAAAMPAAADPPRADPDDSGIYSARTCLEAGNRSVSSDGGACVWFDPVGEHIYVCDTREDGHHPEADYAAEEGDYAEDVAYYGGFGGCRDVDLSLGEGTWIEYRARNVEGTNTLSYGPKKSYTA
jgi:hypothetical protein